jgi:hypothetical protein
MGSSYLRKEEQTIWWRNANLKKAEEPAAPLPELRYDTRAHTAISRRRET